MTDELNPLEQAMDEFLMLGARPVAVLRDLDPDALGHLAAAELLAEQARYSEAAHVLPLTALAALYGMAVGARAERVRQRRFGTHPSEVPPVGGDPTTQERSNPR